MAESYSDNPFVGDYQPTYTMDDVYHTNPYIWDGKARPDVNKYIAPWNYYASQTPYKYTGLTRKKEHNAAIAYAKNQFQAALAQYDADLAFWNERDERDYTDQASQVQRFEDAGFNLGYIYSSVDNGNSAVGYNQDSADFTPAINEGDEFGGVKLIFDCVTSIFSAVTQIARTGIDLKKLPFDISESVSRGGYYGAMNIFTQNKSEFQQMVNSMRSYFQSHDFDGNSVESLSESIQAAFDSIGYKLQNEQYIDKFNWNLYSASVYRLQSTPDGFKHIIQMITDSDMPDWAKSTLSVLTYIFDISMKNTSYSYKK